jgi:uncharacterized membrane protein
VLAYASSALLLGCGAGLLWPRALARTSVVVALCGLSSILLVHGPRIAAQPLEEVRWFGLSEMSIIIAGAWILFARAAPAPGSGFRRAVGGEPGVRRARLLFALALLPVGLSHFFYTKMTASMVPSWLPGHVGWAYLTGAGHLAAGLAILVGVLPRLAATLEALMVSIFVLTVHVPDIFRTPGGRDAWTELFVACFVAGAAFLVVRSYRGATGAPPPE